jgi:hypothetical protein
VRKVHGEAESFNQYQSIERFIYNKFRQFKVNIIQFKRRKGVRMPEVAKKLRSWVSNLPYLVLVLHGRDKWFVTCARLIHGKTGKLGIKFTLPGISVG